MESKAGFFFVAQVRLVDWFSIKWPPPAAALQSLVARSLGRMQSTRGGETVFFCFLRDSCMFLESWFIKVFVKIFLLQESLLNKFWWSAKIAADEGP